tara:strand:+ start:4069 stop:4245 length:177 start_codon:yes stop_codon:yes gene_type:complete
VNKEYFGIILLDKKANPVDTYTYVFYTWIISENGVEEKWGFPQPLESSLQGALSLIFN